MMNAAWSFTERVGAFHTHFGVGNATCAHGSRGYTTVGKQWTSRLGKHNICVSSVGRCHCVGVRFAASVCIRRLCIFRITGVSGTCVACDIRARIVGVRVIAACGQRCHQKTQWQGKNSGSQARQNAGYHVVLQGGGWRVRGLVTLMSPRSGCNPDGCAPTLRSRHTSVVR